MTEERRRAWNRYRDAAVVGAGGPDREPLPPLAERLRLHTLSWWSVDQTSVRAASGKWRDLRLVPIGAGAWLGTVCGVVVPTDAEAALVVGVAAVAAGVVLGGTAWVVMRAVGRRRASRVRGRWGWASSPTSRRAAGVTILAACTALSLAAGCAAALGHGSSQRAGPAGDLLLRGGQTVATVQVTGAPAPQRQGRAFGAGPRFTASAVLLHATDAGRAFSASASILIVGGADVGALRAGTTVEVSGRVVPATRPGTAAMLSITSRPRVVAGDGPLRLVAAVRESLRTSAAWLWSDAAGLLPGMTVGDTTALPAELETAMRDVGLGHLTAVSGANFTLLFGAVLLLLRALRAGRTMSVLGCAAALVAFAIVVGPEPSVLRAAAMGAVGLLALFSGRPGRSCSAISAAVLVLVLLEPPLAVSMGFLLSVVATLGIAVLGPPLTEALATRLPGWLAVAVAVPLSAQLACGPFMILIQPAFLSTSLVANLTSTPFVPIVTVAGTVALATSAWCPPVAFLATAIGGSAAQAVAVIARSLAAAPGATIPWPEGLPGVLAMAGVSVANAVLLWAVLLPSGRVALTSACRGAAGRLRRAPGRPGLGQRSSRGRVDG